MDPVTMTFYGAICGLLAALSPSAASRWTRFGLGIVVGLVAAGVLPFIRRSFGI